MKKMIALCLSLMMILSLTSAMAIDRYSSIELTDKLNIKLELPEGYTVEKERQDTALYAGISPEEEGKPHFLFSIAYADLSEGPTPGELTEEDIEAAKELVGSDFANPTFEVRATGEGTKFLVINENDAEDDYVLMIANYEGYFVQMYIAPADDMEVSDEDITTALAILTSIEVENK
jgi:hypothetical protein